MCLADKDEEKNKIKTDKIPKSILKKDLELDNDIGKALYNLDDKDEKDLPKDKEKIVDKLSSKIQTLKQPNATINDDNITDAVSRLNVFSGEIGNKSGKLSNQDVDEEKMKIFEQLQEGLSGVSRNDEMRRMTGYDDYDILDTSIPELSTALNVYTDSILSPDDVTKRSINYFYKQEVNDNTELTDETQISDTLFDKNMRALIEKFHIDERLSTRTRDALKYGDLFLLILDMHRDANKMLNESDVNEDTGKTIYEQLYENTEDNVLLEKLYLSLKSKDLPEKNDAKSVYNTLDKHDTNNPGKNLPDKDKIIQDTKHDIADKINKNIKFYKNPVNLLNKAKDYQDPSKGDYIDYHFKGAYLKDINPRNIIKLEADDIVFGYVYFETLPSSDNGEGFDASSLTNGNGMSSSSSMLSMVSSSMGMDGSVTTTQTSSTSSSQNGMDQNANNEISNTALRYSIITDLFIKGISKKIGKDFVKKNPEMQNTLFELLRKDYILEKEVKMTFLEPDQVFHLKLDSTTTYGKSRLANSVFAAKLYLATMMTNVITKVTRGRDKKVYYVEVGLDDDIESTVQSLIRDMKSNEFSATSFGNNQSISTVFKNVGAGSELYVPVINGESFSPSMVTCFE